jgi:DNA-directed RNA polymerase specialized sigma24 family protein
MHDDWGAIYENMSDADRRASLWQLIFIDAIKHRPFRQRIVGVLGTQLRTRRSRRIAATPSADAADMIICDLVGSVIRRLSNEECIVFMCKIFGEIPDEEIAEHMQMSLDTVKNLGKHSVRIFRDALQTATKRNPQLSAVVLDPPDAGRS